MADDSKFPTEIIELPSKGYFYPKENPLSSGKVEMRYMTAREEDILTSPNLLRQGVVIDKLLESLVVDKKINLNDLLIGDKNGLIISARILGYGKEYEFSFTTDDGDEIVGTVDLTTLKEKEIDFSKYTKGVNEFSFTLPNSKRVITFKLGTQKEEKEIDKELVALKKISKGVNYQMTTRMKKIITSVDGDDGVAHINSFVDKEFLSQDALAFRKHLTSVTPDVDMMATVKGEDDVEREVAVVLTAQFFWPTA